MLTKYPPEYVLSDLHDAERLNEFLRWQEQVRVSGSEWIRLHITAPEESVHHALRWHDDLRNASLSGTHLKVITVLSGKVSFSAVLIWLASYGRRLHPKTSIRSFHRLKQWSPDFERARKIVEAHITFTAHDEKRFGGALNYRQHASRLLLTGRSLVTAGDLRRYFDTKVES